MLLNHLAACIMHAICQSEYKAGNYVLGGDLVNYELLFLSQGFSSKQFQTLIVFKLLLLINQLR